MTFSRRTFLALASGLLVPETERVRAYSFLPGERSDWLDRLRGMVFDGRADALADAFAVALEQDRIGRALLPVRVHIPAGTLVAVDEDGFAVPATWALFASVIEDANRQINRLILGQRLLGDEGSFRG